MRESAGRALQEFVIRVPESTRLLRVLNGRTIDSQNLRSCDNRSAAALVAANLNARITVAGFMIFIVASVAWMVDGWLETKASLVIQNVILLVINVIGVWRWFPKAEKGAKS